MVLGRLVRPRPAPFHPPPPPAMADERSAMLSEPDEVVVDCAVDRLGAHLDALINDSPIGVSSFARLPPLEPMASHEMAEDDDEDDINDRFTEHAAEQMEQNIRDNEEEENFGGILSVFTKKGRKNMADKHALSKAKKAQHKHHKAETNAEYAKREHEKNQQKLKDKGLASPLLGAHVGDPQLQPPLEKIDFQGIQRDENKKSREEKLRMKAVADQFEKSPSGSADRFAAHIVEFVQKAPGASLGSVVQLFKKNQLAARDPKDGKNYLGQLALGAAMGKVRVSLATQINGAKLERLSKEFHAQSTTPMDAAQATLFSNALTEYLASVRQRATTASQDTARQEALAIDYGAALGETLLGRVQGTGTLNLSHPSVVLAATCDRLHQAVYHQFIGDRKFSDVQVAAFWHDALPTATWKQQIVTHFG